MVHISSPTVSTVQPTSLVKARFGAGRIFYPVRPNQALYAQFKHVAGLPSSQEDGGLSLSKLRSIDNLIDRLVHLKKMSGSSEQREAIDRMIDNLQSQIEATDANVGKTVQENAVDISSLMKGGGVYPPQGDFQGLIFNISA